MKILQYKKTRIAFAPDELTKAINKYSEHYSYVSYNNDHIAEDVDVVHFHNRFIKTNKKQLIQYHSEPVPGRVDLNYPHKKLVISQYHATLRKYKDCKIVKNIINFVETPMYNPVWVQDIIKVGFSPSTKFVQGQWFNKGYQPTKEILQRLKSRYEGKFDYDIITGVSLEECIRRKSLCNVIIDECVTGSFHRSGLEGLALGKYTICSLSKEVTDMLKLVSGSEISPFKNVSLPELEKVLEEIINEGVVKSLDIGKQNREWMETYWHPKDIVDDFIGIYNDL